MSVYTRYVTADWSVKVPKTFGTHAYEQTVVVKRQQRHAQPHQRYGPRAPAAELGLDAAYVPVQIVGHGEVKHDTRDPPFFTEQHARGERLGDEEAPHHELPYVGG